MSNHGWRAPPTDETELVCHPRDEPPDLESDKQKNAVLVSGWTGWGMAVGNEEKEEYYKSSAIVDLQAMR